MFRYLIIFLILTLLGYVYDKYKQREQKRDNLEHNDLVRKYLLNEGALAGGKPIIWVHLDYENNSRQWLNFGSRNTKQLNQPYKLLTLQSIINKAGDDFNVCLIDDESFGKLLPGWSINMDQLANPVKTYMRSLAFTKILYTYGGFFVPSSYTSLHYLSGLYDTGLKDHDCFVVETLNRNVTSTYTSAFPNHLFMGCRKGSQAVKELIQFIERINSKDCTNEQKFLGEVDRKCFDLIQKNEMTLLEGRLVGCFDKESKPVLVDNLLQSSYIDFSDNLQGILIPDNEILNRIKYQWFARLSPEQIVGSNIILSKYLLLSTK